MEYLNETSVGDMLNVIDAIAKVLTTTPEPGSGDSKLKTILKNSTSKSQYKGSLSSRANKLVMTFPVLCSNTVTASTASMISKAIERKCTLMIQQIFAADILVANANQKGKTPIESKINDVYTGIDFDLLSVDDMIKITNNLTAKQGKAFFEQTYLNEVADLSKKKVNGAVYESSVSESSVSALMIDSHTGRAEADPEMVVQEAKAKVDVNKYYNRDLIGNDYISKLGDLFNDANVPLDQVRDAVKNGDVEDILKINKDIRDRTGVEIDLDKLALDIAKDDREAKMFKKQMEKIKDDIKHNRRKMDLEIEKNEREKLRAQRDKEAHAAQMKAYDRQELQAKNDYFKKQLMDTDVKKVNELVPSMLVVNFAVETDKGNIVQDSAIVGVKTRLVSLDSFQILDKMASKNKDKSGLVKFIKATTGEIKFLKDFVLAIDKAKIDALNKSKRGSANPIWRVLERRAAVNNLRAALGQKNDASPITTLVITQEEVDYLRKTADMDLENVNVANFILNAYNLMGLCIVDEAAEVAKFLFDGEFNQFDSYAFTSLQKEAGDNGMYKKVINLMAKRM